MDEIQRLKEILADKDRQIAELKAAGNSPESPSSGLHLLNQDLQSLLFSPLMDILPDGVIVTDDDGKILTVTPKIVELYGAEDSDFFIGKSVFGFLESNENQRAGDNYRELLLGNKIGATAYKAKNLRGETIYFEVNAAVIGDASESGLQIIHLVRDLSLRRKLEATFNENQKLLTDIIENSSTLIFLKDMEGRYIKINRAFSELTGLMSSDAIGKTDLELYGSEVSEHYRQTDQQVEKSNKPIKVEEWLEYKGKRTYYATTKFPVYGSDGTMKAICGMSVDITELKLSQQNSDRQLRLQQLLIETSNTYIDLPVEMVDQSINESLKNLGEYLGADRFYLFRYDFVNMTASNTHEWCAEGIEPQIDYLKETPVDDLHDWLAAHRQGNPFVIYDVLALSENDAARKILEPQGIKSIITVPIMDGSECLGFAGFDAVQQHYLFGESDAILLNLFTRMVMNVLKRYKQETQLKEANRRLTTLMNNLKGYAFRCRFDADYTAEFISDGIEEISGYASSKLIQNNEINFNSIILPADVEMVRRIVSQAVELREPYFLEYRIVHANGSIRWVWEKGQPVFENDGNLFLEGFVTDISDRKLAEKSLQMSEVKYRFIAENTSDGLLVLDQLNRLVYVSPGYLKQLGYHDDDLSLFAGDYLQNLVHPDDLKDVVKTIQYAVEKQAHGHTYSYRAMHQNGSTIWLEDNAAFLYDESGKLQTINIISREITARRNAEEQIRNLSIALEKSPVSIVITDTNANVVYFNSSVLQTSGYSMEEIIGQNPRIFKSDKTREETYKNMWETITSGNQWQGEWLNKKKNGDYYWEKVSISPIYSESGQIINYLAIKLDITDIKNIENEIRDLNLNLEKKIAERTHELEYSNQLLKKEIEERVRIETALQFKTDQLEKFFTVSLDLLCITTLEGQFIEVNKAWEVLLGFSSDQIRSKRFFDLIHPSDIESTREAVESLINGNTIAGFTNRYITSKGDYRNIEWHSVKVENLIYGAARDVTERIGLEQSLRESIEREKGLNELKSRFISTASHEFQTPLSSILMSASALLNYWDMYSREQVVSKLENIAAKARHLSENVTNVLQVSRIQAGQVNFNPATFDLILLCRRAIKDVETDFQIRGVIDFRTSLSTLPIWGDRLLILQALLNLVSNAVKYSQPNPEVFVSLNVEKGSIIICVGDNGIGIPKIDIDNLFDPFFRGANVQNIEGNGLGLAIVKDSIELHNGSVWVDTILNVGTKFYVSLPYK